MRTGAASPPSRRRRADLGEQRVERHRRVGVLAVGQHDDRVDAAGLARARSSRRRRARSRRRAACPGGRRSAGRRARSPSDSRSDAERLDLAQHGTMFCPGRRFDAGRERPDARSRRCERKWPSVACAPSIAPSSLERPSPIGLVHRARRCRSARAPTRACGSASTGRSPPRRRRPPGAGSVTAGLRGVDAVLRGEQLAERHRLVERPEPVLRAGSAARPRSAGTAANASPASRCTGVTHGAPSTVTGLSDHIDPPSG